jgi:hypothetical protein
MSAIGPEPTSIWLGPKSANDPKADMTSLPRSASSLISIVAFFEFVG